MILLALSRSLPFTGIFLIFNSSYDTSPFFFFFFSPFYDFVSHHGWDTAQLT